MRLGSYVVLVDHAAEYPPTLHRRTEGHDDWFVMVGWSLVPGLMRPVAVVAPGRTRPSASSRRCKPNAPTTLHETVSPAPAETLYGASRIAGTAQRSVCPGGRQ